MIEKEECFHVARCTRPHGVNGEIVLRIETGFTVEAVSFDFVFIELQGGLVPFYVEEIREKNQDEVILKFADVSTQEQARILCDASVFVYRSWLDDEGADVNITGSVIGFMAEDQQFGELGVITRIQEIAKNPLFIIDYQERELMVPIVEQFIVSIDGDRRRILFNLPEGLLEL